VLSGLSVLGNACLEFTNTGSDDEDSTIGLRSARYHILDEISVSRGVDHSDIVLGSLELPEGNIDSDTSLSLGLEFVKNPCVLEGRLSELGSLLLELLDGSLVDTSTFVDQMTGGGRLSGVYVSDNNDVNVSLLFTHFDRCFLFLMNPWVLVGCGFATDWGGIMLGGDAFLLVLLIG